MANVIEFDTSKKRQSTNYDYPKLHLDNKEKARVLVIEKAPVFEWVHTLEAPQIVNGKAVMFTDKRKNGSEFQNYKTDFLTRAICLGDVGTVNEEGSDPKHCPMCMMAKTSPDMMKPPVRRFAMHVVRYKTKSSGTGFEPTTPFQVELVVWAFTDTVFSQLVDFKETWGSLQKHDLLLGPCTNKMYQKFDINVAPDALWQGDDKRKHLVLETYKNNTIEDLSVACGSRKERRWIDIDLATIRERWAQVSENAPTLEEDLKNLNEERWADGKTEAEAKAEKKAAKRQAAPADDDLDSILGGDDSTGDDLDGLADVDTGDAGDDEDMLGGGESEAEPDEEPSGDDDLLGGGDDEEEAPAPVKAAPKKAAKPAPKKETVPPTSDEDDLDALLGD